MYMYIPGTLVPNRQHWEEHGGFWSPRSVCGVGVGSGNVCWDMAVRVQTFVGMYKCTMRVV